MMSRRRNHANLIETPPTDQRRMEASRGTRLGELATLFLRLGLTAFGGPAAHVAMMEDEVVARRRWLTREEFLDLLGATNLIPGPNSTEMAIHVGHRRAGFAGLAVAGDVLDGINLGSLALMAVVTVQLGIAAVVDVATVVLVLASAVLLIRYRLNSTWLVLGGALAGSLAFAAR
jgi:chromate transporter